MKRKKMSPPKRVMHSIHNQKFWTEFFSMYESLPVLWDMNNRMYKDRQSKCDAYDILVDKLREIEPTADREDVVRKINIFRTNYRRECARINISQQEGRKYQSTLWYLDLLSFIQTADTRRDRKRNVDDDGEKSIMRKRRATNVIRKSPEQFSVPEKKDNLIEYEPHSTHEFEYDLEEQTSFKYVPDELSHVLVDGKVDSSTENQQNNLGVSNYHDVEEERTEENNRQEEFTYYALKRGFRTNKKINLSQLDDEITTNDNLLEMNDASEEHRSEYAADNETETLKPAEWCIKTENSRSSNTVTNKTINFSDNASIKFVRDVMTMTLNNTHESCSRKLSESSEILSKSWAVQYEELNQDQKVLARKAINDILFEGYMGHLAMGSSGRVTIRDAGYKTSKTSPNEEVESSEVYEQQSTNIIASSGSSITDHGSASSITLTTSVASTSKVHTNEEWIKL